MDIPRLRALHEQWRLEPPVAPMVASLAGYEPPPSHDELRAFERIADALLKG